MTQLRLIKKSISSWSNKIKDCDIKEIPVNKSAAELIGGYEKVKVSNILDAVKNMDRIDPRLHKNI